MEPETILGVILAGGKSRRMGVADKFLLHHQGKSLLEHTLIRASGQVSAQLITTNGPVSRLPPLKFPVVADQYDAYSGPLAGIITAMLWASQNLPSTQLLASFPADSITCPDDWVARCQQRMAKHQLSACCAATPGGAHYTYGLWSISMLPQLQESFASGTRSLKTFFDPHPEAFEHYLSDAMFSNINTPEDLKALNQSS